MSRALVLCLVVLVALCGCKKEPPPPPEKPPPPPPTTQELAVSIKACLEPLRTLTRDAPAGRGWGSGGTGAAGRLTNTVENKVVDCLKSEYQKNRGQQNGPEALTVVQRELEGIIRTARDQERWRLTLGCIHAFQAIAPNATKMDNLLTRCELHMKRPIVRLRGFFDDDEKGETYAFLEFTLRPSQEKHKERMRIGDRKHEVELLDFVGDKKGVRLEYLLIPGNVWEVLGP